VTNNNGFWIGFIGTSFTITVNYNSSHIELLNAVCLTNLYEESLTAQSKSKSHYD
jgi:hypothetical protein